MRHQRDTVGEWPLVELAERQEGLLRWEQLLALGLDGSAIARRTAAGRLHRRHHLVYTLGHRLLSPRGRVVAAGWSIDGGVATHLSAALWHGWHTEPLVVQHVSTTRCAKSRDGIVVHRVRALAERDVDRWGLVAVSRPERTIVDLAELLPFGELRSLADRMRRPDVAAIRAAQDRAPRKRGAANVRRLLGRLDAHTKSEFERRYLCFCRAHGVPLPDAVNDGVAGFLVDCHYRSRGIVIELDSRAWHARQDQMRTDRRRDRKVLRAGCATVRLVWEDLDDEEATETADDLRAILA